jgi:hypothetical protein
MPGTSQLFMQLLRRTRPALVDALEKVAAGLDVEPQIVRRVVENPEWRPLPARALEARRALGAKDYEGRAVPRGITETYDELAHARSMLPLQEIDPVSGDPISARPKGVKSFSVEPEVSVDPILARAKPSLDPEVYAQLEAAAREGGVEGFRKRLREINVARPRTEPETVVTKDRTKPRSGPVTEDPPWLTKRLRKGGARLKSGVDAEGWNDPMVSARTVDEVAEAKGFTGEENVAAMAPMEGRIRQAAKRQERALAERELPPDQRRPVEERIGDLVAAEDTVTKMTRPGPYVADAMDARIIALARKIEKRRGRAGRPRPVIDAEIQDRLRAFARKLTPEEFVKAKAAIVERLTRVDRSADQVRRQLEKNRQSQIGIFTPEEEAKIVEKLRIYEDPLVPFDDISPLVRGGTYSERLRDEVRSGEVGGTLNPIMSEGDALNASATPETKTWKGRKQKTEGAETDFAQDPNFPQVVARGGLAGRESPPIQAAYPGDVVDTPLGRGIVEGADHAVKLEQPELKTKDLSQDKAFNQRPILDETTYPRDFLGERPIVDEVIDASTGKTLKKSPEGTVPVWGKYLPNVLRIRLLAQPKAVTRTRQGPAGRNSFVISRTQTELGEPKLVRVPETEVRVVRERSQREDIESKLPPDVLRAVREGRASPMSLSGPSQVPKLKRGAAKAGKDVLAISDNPEYEIVGETPIEFVKEVRTYKTASGKPYQRVFYKKVGGDLRMKRRGKDYEFTMPITEAVRKGIISPRAANVRIRVQAGKTQRQPNVGKWVRYEEASPASLSKGEPGYEQTVAAKAAAPAPEASIKDPSKVTRSALDALAADQGVRQAPKYGVDRTGAATYEVSTKGDKRFSALNARLKDGRTIEEAYQLDVKGYRKQGNDWRLGKGKPPLNGLTREQVTQEYQKLWDQWAEENPDLVQDLLKRMQAKGTTFLSDVFAQQPGAISQAKALANILNRLDPAEPVLARTAAPAAAPAAQITREEIRANPNTIYVFGDNLKGVGTGGQAAVARGEANVIGIPTKKAPSMDPGAFFSDKEYDANVAAIRAAFDKIWAARAAGKTIKFFPGIGEGLAELQKRAPRTFQYLQQQIAKAQAGPQNRGKKNIGPSIAGSAIALGAVGEAARSAGQDEEGAKAPQERQILQASVLSPTLVKQAGKALMAGARAMFEKPPVKKVGVSLADEILAKQRAPVKVEDSADPWVKWVNRMYDRFVPLWADEARIASKTGIAISPRDSIRMTLPNNVNGGLYGVEEEVRPLAELVQKIGQKKQLDLVSQVLALRGAVREWDVLSGKATKLKHESDAMYAAGADAGARRKAEEAGALLGRIKRNEVLPLGMSREQAQAELDGVLAKMDPQTRAEVEAAATGVYRMSKRALTRMEEEGLISKEEADIYRGRGEDYVPMYRIMAAYDEGTNGWIQKHYLRAGRYGASKARLSVADEGVLEKMEGSTRVNVDPLMAMTRFLANANTEIKRNQTARFILDTQWQRWQDPKLRPFMKDEIVKWGNRPPTKVREGFTTVAYMDKGKPVYFEVPKDFGDAMNFADVETLRGALKTTRFLRQVFHAMAATANPAFAAVQVVKDPLAARILLPWGQHGGKFDGMLFGKLWAETFLRHIGKVDKVPWLSESIAKRTGALPSQMEKEGGIAGAFGGQLGYLMDPEEVVFGRKWGTNPLKYPMKGAEWVTEHMLQPLEMGTKMASYGTLRAAGKFDPIEAAYLTRKYGGSPDFQNYGSLTKDWGDYYMFLNPAVQGIGRTWEMSKQDPARMAAWAGGLAATYYALAQYNSEFIDPQTGKPEILSVPKGERQTNIIIMLPRAAAAALGMNPDAQGLVQYSTGQSRHPYIKIPLDHTAQQLMSPLISILQGAEMVPVAEGEGTLEQGIADFVSNNLPGGVPIEANNIVGSVVRRAAGGANPLIKGPAEAWAGKNFFTNAPIVGRRIENRPITEEYTLRTDPVALAAARTMGQSDFVREQLPILASPDRLEHLYRAFFPGLGEMAMGAAQAAIPRPQSVAQAPTERWANLPVAGPIARRFLPSTHSQERLTSMSNFYDLANQVREAKTAWTDLPKRDPARFQEYVQLHPESQTLQALNASFVSWSRELATIDRSRELLQRLTDPRLTPEIRQQKMAELYKKEQQVLAEASAVRAELIRRGLISQ